MVFFIATSNFLQYSRKYCPLLVLIINTHNLFDGKNNYIKDNYNIYLNLLIIISFNADGNEWLVNFCAFYNPSFQIMSLITQSTSIQLLNIIELLLISSKFNFISF